MRSHFFPVTAALAAALGVGAIGIRPARAAAPPCNNYSNIVVASGATAAQAIFQQAAAVIGNGVSIIYLAPGSCIGPTDLLGNTSETSSAYYLDPANPTKPVQCDPTNGGTTPLGVYVDIGVTDVYASSCNLTLASGYADFHGPIVSYSFAVPLSQYTGGQTSISAEAAYVVFGWAGQTYSISPWTDPTQMFIRSPSAGVEQLLATAIGLPASKWLAQSPIEGGAPQHLGSNNAVVSALAAASNPGAAIGIVASEYVDANRGKLATLAYQGKDPNGPDGDQLCGYLPDSDATHFDKINVRQGRYELWGPLHLITNVDGTGKPIPNPNNTGSGDVAKVVQYLNFASTLSTADATSMIKAAQTTYLIPPCAMEVTRTAEVGPEASFQPNGARGCFYESLAGGGTTTSSYCQTCAGDADCADAGVYKHCNYGYCEAQ